MSTEKQMICINCPMGCRMKVVLFGGQVSKVSGNQCHPAVAQWNYSVGDSDFHLSVDHQPSIAQKSGDFSFVPAGPDHSLAADPGKEVFYVWYEHYTRERDFMVTLAKGDKLEDKLKH